MLLGKDIRRVGCASNVSDSNLLEVLDGFTDAALADVDVTHGLVAGSLGPVDAGLVVIVDRCRSSGTKF